MQSTPYTSEELIHRVRSAHGRTLALVEDLEDSQLAVPLIDRVNPFLWELGHVAFFYDDFLLRELDGGELLMKHGNEMYNSFDVAHDDRWGLDFPDREATCAYMSKICSRVVGRLEGREPSDRERYLYLLATQHEDMHGEAFTYTRQGLALPAPSVVVEARGAPRTASGSLPGDVQIPGGTYRLGASEDGSFVYDNEKWGHSVQVESFRIARAPVTCTEFQAFLEDGGYARREFWSHLGWQWLVRNKVEHPCDWREHDGSWAHVCYGQVVPIEPHHPVCNVSWYEAEAFCAWAGRRLPSEAEWELAASGTPADLNAGRRYTWGDEPHATSRANLASAIGCTVDVADFAEGDSAFGCRQMIGNVWEWTSSDFYPFPGYLLDHPYKEYSAPWFGDRKVLRGGSWATQAGLAYATYRNFFEPQRADIFSGFRTCALGAESS